MTQNQIRELSCDEVDLVGGAGFLDGAKKLMGATPEEVKFLGAVGAGAMVGACAGPWGAVGGAVIGGIGYALGM